MTKEIFESALILSGFKKYNEHIQYSYILDSNRFLHIRFIDNGLYSYLKLILFYIKIWVFIFNI